MTPTTSTDKGYTELILHPNGGWDAFYQTADLLASLPELSFLEKLNDFDSAYWDFSFRHSILVLHYNTFLGVSIYPKVVQKASVRDNENTFALANLLTGNWRRNAE